LGGREAGFTTVTPCPGKYLQHFLQGRGAALCLPFLDCTDGGVEKDNGEYKNGVGNVTNCQGDRSGRQ